MSKKTYKDAAKQIPDERARDAFVAAWKDINLADLYDGELYAYMEAILDELKQRKQRLENANEVFNLIKTKVDGIHETLKYQ